MPFPHAGELAGLACALLWAVASFLWARVGEKVTALGISAVKASVGLALLTLILAARLGTLWPVALTGRQQGILLASGVIGLGIGDAVYFMSLLATGPR